MKKCVVQNVAKVTGIIGGVTVAFASATVYANAAEGIYIVPSVAYQWIEDDEVEYNINGDTSLGFALGRQLTDSWGIELAYNLTATEFDKDTKLGDVDAEYMHIDAIYTAPAFNPGSQQPWSGYVVFGVGSMDYEAENKISSFKDDTTWNLGVGLQNDITPSLAFRTDLRSVMVKDDILGAYFNVGLVYAFGEAQPKPAPVKAAPTPVAPVVAEPVAAVVVAPAPVENKDIDADGVPDAQDKCPDTAQGAKVDADGCYQLLKQTKEFTLNVTFASGKSNLEAGSVEQIAKLARFLVSYPQTKVVVEGHTDSVGSAESNKSLSQRRADAVRQSLINDYKIAAERVTAIGYGEEQPIADNASKEGQAKNRRVVAKVAAEEMVRK